MYHGSLVGMCVTEQHGKKNSSMMSSLLAATTSSEQDHDNAIFGSEHISVSTTKSSVVQEEPMAVSVKVAISTFAGLQKSTRLALKNRHFFNFAVA